MGGQADGGRTRLGFDLAERRDASPLVSIDDDSCCRARWLPVGPAGASDHAPPAWLADRDPGRGG